MMIHTKITVPTTLLFLFTLILSSTVISLIYSGNGIMTMLTHQQQQLQQAYAAKPTTTTTNIDNNNPIAQARANPSIANEGGSVSLDGSRSFDRDGTIVSYVWRQTAGPSVGPLPNSQTVSFKAPIVSADTELRFTLTVTDNMGASTTTNTVSVLVKNVNQAPTSNLKSSQTTQNTAINSRQAGVGPRADGQADLVLHFMVKCAGLFCPSIEEFRYSLRVIGFGNTGSPTSFSGSKSQTITINIHLSPDNPDPGAAYSISQRVPPTPPGLVLTQRVSGDNDACQEGFSNPTLLFGQIGDREHKVCTIEYDYRKPVTNPG